MKVAKLETLSCDAGWRNYHFVKLTTDTGIVGHGFTAITEEDVVAQVVNGVIAPNLIGDDPLLNERIWEKLYWTVMPRGQTGYAAHALAA